MKKFFKIVGIGFISGILLFTLSRHGWRVFGFSMCDSPSSLYAEMVSVENDILRIKGGTTSSASAYVGHIYVVEDRSLYVGVKHNTLLGFINRWGDFYIRIAVDTTHIENVYFKDKNREKLIWNVHEGLIRTAPQATQSIDGAAEDNQE
ncbi:hypothetical protein [Geosporobacter ferrireducens]|uniref:Uncharacterized protein n=1 Tax=Geosporobacter ferrireducens TaxID=1424294 RepID=A0A1D8GK64_9FIRM|nr:hypothetical protein [Geosporobacter ferrireducens]AOT71298.1 hypothetical protein Gferi_18090 [Geosporobacter ferrireducens]MTI58112.1 hypothetical protein [Geosporobacter ferrireducens]